MRCDGGSDYLCVFVVDADEWSAWSDYTSCSVSCGGGLRERTRACVSPDGVCEGDDTESIRCGEWSCPSKRYVYLNINS